MDDEPDLQEGTLTSPGGDVRPEEESEGRTGNPPETSHPALSSSIRHESLLPETLPVYLRYQPPNEHVSLTYFPMGPTGSQLSQRIAAVSRNTADGRIRCEIANSTIHGKEETAEGLPVDYHLVWESSPASANTFRNDYHAVKQNGKLLLTPISVVHMRTVLEPKCARSGTQRMGLVSQSLQQNAKHDPAASSGKWVNYEIDAERDGRVLHVDEKNLRHAPFRKDERAADFDALVKSALVLDVPSGPATGSRPLASSRADPSRDKVEMFFHKSGRVQQTSSIQKAVNKPIDETIKALKKCAYLVQGNWVGHSTLFFKDKPADKGKLPFHMVYDYLLCFFSRDRIVDVTVPNKVLKLSVKGLNGVLGMVAKHVVETRWRFANDPDMEFIRTHPDLVKEQMSEWERRRAEIEAVVEGMEKTNAAVAVTNGVNKAVDPPPTPSIHVTEETKPEPPLKKLAAVSVPVVPPVQVPVGKRKSDDAASPPAKRTMNPVTRRTGQRGRR